MLANFAVEVVAIGVADGLPNYLDIGAEAKRLFVIQSALTSEWRAPLCSSERQR
ncbi:hypothetical protein DAVIS_04898 [Mycobacterium marinum]|uniref:Uncharacterized protein n=1 Tax=Mycobacterium marinum TaxID=1781 RepID=A0A3E2MPG5_MYCMR|nr:hypothetical protein DAVIS_04898 [Mycobacterium marinum]